MIFWNWPIVPFVGPVTLCSSNKKTELRLSVGLIEVYFFEMATLNSCLTAQTNQKLEQGKQLASVRKLQIQAS